MPFTGEETTSRTYGWAAFRGATTLVRLDTQMLSFMRAPMEMASFFALESAVDELAEKLAMDPVALRIRTMPKADPISGKPFSSRNLVQCLQRGAERFGWSRRKPAPRSMRLDDGTLVGWGVAAGAYPAYITPAIARIRLHSDGRVDLSVGAHEMGQGFAARSRLLRRKNSAYLPVTSDPHRRPIVPPQHVTSGSTGAATVSIPISRAALRLRGALAELAVTTGRAICRRRSGRDALTRRSPVFAEWRESESVANILARAGIDHVDGVANGTAPGMTPEAFAQAALGKVAFLGPEFPDYVSFSYIAHFVEVQVDPLAAASRHADGVRRRLRSRAEPTHNGEPDAGRARLGHRRSLERSERGRSAFRWIPEQ